MDVFDLFAKISLDTSDYDNGLADAEKSASSFGKTIGSGIAKTAKIGATAIAGVTTAAAGISAMFIKGAGDLAEYGDNIDKMSQKLGLSAESYQEWEAVMQHSGTTMSAMSRGMQTLQKNAVNSADKFEALGITQEELAQMSTEEIFAATIEGLQNMGEGAERTALASELLGGSAKELGALLNTSAEETKAMRNRVHELGGVMSNEAVKASAKYQDTLQDMQTALSGAKRGIQQEFLPAITDVMDGLTDLFTGKDGMPKINEGIRSFVNKMVEALPKVLETGTQIILSLADAIIDNIPQIISAGVQVVAAFVKGIIKNRKKILEAAKQIIKTFVDTLVKEFPALKGVVDKIKSVFDAVFGFIKDNGPLIQGILKGILATLIAYKATIAIITGIQKAVTLVTTAIKLLNGELAVTAALNPFTAIAAAVAIAVGAIMSVVSAEQAALQEHYEEVAKISEATEQAAETASQYSESLKSIYSANEDVVRSVEAELQPTQNLANELKTIVDENGKIKTGYEERAKVIAEELSEAIGTEITLQDGVIQNYDEILTKLDEIILKKKAEALIDANRDKYIQTMKEQTDMFVGMNNAQKELNATQFEYNKKLEIFKELKAEWDSAGPSMAIFDPEGYGQFAMLLTEVPALQEKLTGLKEKVGQTSQAYYEAQDFLKDYNNLTEIVAGGAGDLEKAVTDMTNGIVEAAPKEILLQQVEDAKKSLSDMLEARASGSLVSDDLIQTATEKLASAVDAMNGLGEDASGGYAEGLKDNEDVVDAAEQMIKDATEAVQTAQDSHSPSRVFKKEGVNAVTGYGKGIAGKKSWLKTVIEGVMTEVKTEFTKNTPNAFNWGADLMKSFIEGIKSEMAELKLAVKQVATVVADNLEHSHPKEGPMADDYKWMPDMMHLFASGIKDNAYLVEDAAVNAFDLKDTMQMPEFDNARSAYKWDSTDMIRVSPQYGDSANTNKVIELLQEIADNGMSVTLAGDADGIFTVVERENRKRTKATRYNALSMMRS